MELLMKVKGRAAAEKERNREATFDFLPPADLRSP